MFHGKIKIIMIFYNIINYICDKKKSKLKVKNIYVCIVIKMTNGTKLRTFFMKEYFRLSFTQSFNFI